MCAQAAVLIVCAILFVLSAIKITLPFVIWSVFEQLYHNGKVIFCFALLRFSEHEKLRRTQPAKADHKKKFCKYRTLKMQEMGLEPTHSHLRQILSLMRLPFRHSCLRTDIIIP